MTHPITLNSVATAFAHWRKARRSRREPVPVNLQRQAIELLAHYKQTHVLNALKINHTLLKRWQQNSVAPQVDFVSLPPQVCQTPAERALEVTLSNRFGAQMTITGSLSAEQLAELTRSFTSAQGGEQ